MERRGKTISYVNLKWERELGVKISDDEWSHIWRTQQSATSSRVWRLYCWKNLIRSVITPKTRSKYLSVPQPCWRKCGAINVDHSHVFWLCTNIEKFWEDVHLVIVGILGYDISKTCMFLYFGSMTGNVVLKEDKYLLKILLAACKKAITRKWYTPDPPTQDNWLKILNEIYVMEQLTHRIRTQEDQCREKWEKWTSYSPTTG